MFPDYRVKTAFQHGKGVIGKKVPFKNNKRLKKTPSTGFSATRRTQREHPNSPSKRERRGVRSPHEKGIFVQIKKASMASLKARKPWRLAAARNRKGSCITLQLVILLPNQVGPCTSAQEVWHGRRDKRRNHAALTKTGHKSHDGVVNKDDDHRKPRPILVPAR